MSVIDTTRPTRSLRGEPDGPSGLARGVGMFYLVMGGINIGIVVADSSRYGAFADAGLFGFVRSGWSEIVMAHPGWWIGALAAGEIAIGLAFQGSARWRRAAYAAAIAFHLALLMFGWWVAVWVGPALLVLVLGLRRELQRA